MRYKTNIYCNNQERHFLKKITINISKRLNYALTQIVAYLNTSCEIFGLTC